MTHFSDRRTTILLAISLFLGCSAVYAGGLEPPGPPSPTMKTLPELEPRFGIHGEMLPMTISEPGSYYFMVPMSAGDGITIASSDVTIDLNGFALIGTGVGTGITVSGSHANITVRNGVVRGWGNAGIDLGGAESSLVENVLAHENGGAGIAVGSRSVVRASVATGNLGNGIEGGDDVAVHGCAAHNNQIDGVRVGENSSVVASTASGNGDDGFDAGSGSTLSDCTTRANGNDGFYLQGNPNTGGMIRGCSSRSNVANGFKVGMGGSIVDSLAADNGWIGFALDMGGVATNCSAIGNGADGFNIIDGCTVSHSTSRENHGNGIAVRHGNYLLANNCSRNGSVADPGGNGAGILVTGVDNRVEGNLVLSNDRGIDVDNAGNVIVLNSASGSATNYDIVGGNDVGPIGSAASSASPWANVQF